MRTKKSLYNLATALGGQGISLVFSLISRIVFVHYLTQEYLGLSGLFTNILTMLSLVELGIGASMTYSLYKPLADGDTELIKSLMRLYQKTYCAVGVAILVLGGAFTPFYRFFIAGPVDIPNLDAIYLLYVANTALSYFFSYKISLINADQNQYIRNFWHYGFYVALNLAQIGVLAATQNYILFLVCQLVFTFLENFALSRVADRMYPYLRDREVRPLTDAVLSPIVRNVKAMMCHKIGSMVVNSTDNILLSKFLGLAVAGVYSNYSLVLSALTKILSQVFGAATASVGNVGAKNERAQMQAVFDRMHFLNFWIYGFCAICLRCLLQPFIQLAFGAHFLFDDLTVTMLVISFFLTGMRQAPLLLRSATGLYYRDWFKPLLEVAVNLVASIWLLKIYGSAGVFMGTIASTVLVCAWIEVYVVHRYLLEKRVWGYWRAYLAYTAATLLAGGATWFICQWLSGVGIGAFIRQVLACAIIPNLVFCLLFARDKNFRYFAGLIGKIVRHFLARRAEK